MTEHKLSEQERKQIIKLIDKRRNWLDENSIQDWNKEDTLFIAVAALTRERERVKRIEKVFREDTPYPLSFVLEKLITAAEILLYKKDYDGPDYEEMNHAVKSGKEIIEEINNYKNNK